MADFAAKPGEVWDIQHARKGAFTAKIVAIVAEWCDLEIVEGRARHMVNDDAMPGDPLRARLSFLTPIQRRPELE